MRHIPVRRDGKTGSSCPSGVLTKEDVDRERCVDGRRWNRTLISFITRLRFAMTARTRFTLDCTGNGRGPLHRCVRGSRAVQDCRPAMLAPTLAVRSMASTS
jgi:hypothetical protein